MVYSRSSNQVNDALLCTSGVVAYTRANGSHKVVARPRGASKRGVRVGGSIRKKLN